MSLFSLDHSSRRYGQQVVLDNLCLSIKSGEKIALIGPSGAGKSSLLKLLFEQQPSSIALCPQTSGLVGILSVFHNIYMGQLERHSALYNLWNLVFPIVKHRHEIELIAQELGLNEQLTHSIDQLSGGQQQRVAIGRAIYRQQPIFFGDEPVSSLDQVQSQQILSALIRRHETAVVVLHDMSLAINHFDRVIGLKNGSIRFDLPTNQISENELKPLYAK